MFLLKTHDVPCSTSTEKLPEQGKYLRAETPAYLYNPEFFAATWCIFDFPFSHFYLTAVASNENYSSSRRTINYCAVHELFIKMKFVGGNRGKKSITQFSIFNGLRHLLHEAFIIEAGWRETIKAGNPSLFGGVCSSRQNPFDISIISVGSSSRRLREVADTPFCVSLQPVRDDKLLNGY